MRLSNHSIVTVTLAAGYLVLAGCATHQHASQTRVYAPPPDAAATMTASLHTHKAAAIGIGVIRGGKLAWSGVYGRQEAGVPATRDTMFNVASLAKPVSAEVIVQLIATGRIGLDEPMSDTWIDPDLVTDERHRKLTPRIALSHQTGFANWRSQSAGSKLAFESGPGTAFTYSGEGYEYLRRFAELKTGKTFEALADGLVFNRIDMRSTAYSEKPWMRDRVAAPMDREGVFKSPDVAKSGNANAADNLFVTVEDFATFMISVVNDDGLPATLARERQRMQVAMPASSPCGDKPVEGCPTRTYFTLGWTAYQFGERVILSNSGMDWGEFALVYIDPATRDGMLLLTNGGNGVKVAMDALDLFDHDSPVAAFGRAQMRK